ERTAPAPAAHDRRNPNPRGRVAIIRRHPRPSLDRRNSKQEDRMRLHDANCTGCPRCNPEFAAAMKMSPPEYVKWLKTRTAAHMARHATAGQPQVWEGALLRSAETHPPRVFQLLRSDEERLANPHR